MRSFLSVPVLAAVLLSVAAMAGAQANPQTTIVLENGGDRLRVDSGGELDVKSGGALDVESGGTFALAGTTVTSTAAELNILDGVTSTAAELNKTDGLAATGYVPVTDGCSFTEAGGTTYTCTITLPAGAVINNIQFVTTVLWDDGTSASLGVGDADDADGWFTTVDLKATDLVVGEVLDISNAENWGGVNGAYLVAATGRKGQAVAAYSGVYSSVASEVIFVVTTGAQDGTAGRSFGWVTYTVPTLTASTSA